MAAAAQHFDFGGYHLDVAGGQLGIFAVPLPYQAGDLDGGLLVESLDGGHHLLGLDDHLGDAVEVPQDHKGKILPHFPDVFQEAGQGDGLAHMLHAQLTAGMGTGLNHNNQLQIVLLFL